MRNLKKVCVVMLAVVALGAVAAANASAGRFTFAATGNFAGNQNSNHEIDDTGNNPGHGAINTLTCTKALTTGKANVLETKELFVEINYGSCTAFLGVGANVNKASLTFTVSGSSNNIGTVDVTNTVNAIIGTCELHVKPQTNAGVTFSSASGAITVTYSINSLNSTGNGGACGTSHAGGTYVGSTTLSSAVSLEYDKS